jgi:hypothetical protein
MGNVFPPTSVIAALTPPKLNGNATGGGLAAKVPTAIFSANRLTMESGANG